MPDESTRRSQSTRKPSPQPYALAGFVGLILNPDAGGALSAFKAVCLPRAMAARLMLERRCIKSVMRFGAAKGQGKWPDAHPWFDTAGAEVTGYPVAENFAEIACFV